MERFLWVCLGGAVGTGARYLVSGWTLRLLGPGFSWGTLAVNLLGSFLLGLVAHVGLTTGALPATGRIALTTGVLGGFTTYSTFNHETLRAFEDGAWGLAAINVAATVAGCLVAGLLGLALGRLLVRS